MRRRKKRIKIKRTPSRCCNIHAERSRLGPPVRALRRYVVDTNTPTLFRDGRLCKRGPPLEVYVLKVRINQKEETDFTSYYTSFKRIE